MKPTRTTDWRRRAALLLGMTPLALTASCARHNNPDSATSHPVATKEVVVVAAIMETWPQTIRVQGSLLPYDVATVGSKLAGRVAEVAVDVGTVVKQGQVLVRLERDEFDLQLELAQAQLEQACAAIGLTPADDERKYDVQHAPGVMLEQALVKEAQSAMKRAQQLLTSRALTQAEHDAILAQLEAAQARYDAALHLVGEQVSLIGVRRKELALARQMVTNSEVIAPFDGIVGERRVAPGEFVQPGQAVVSLVRADRLRYTAGVPESRSAEVRVGQRVEIKRGPDETSKLVATISRLSPTVTQTSRSILIEADVPNDDLQLQAGLFAEADIVVDPHALTLVVPASAVSQFAGVHKVWTVADGVARQQTVRVGRQDDWRIEILDGLAEGDLLVRTAAEGHDGPVVAVHEPADDAAPTAEAGGISARLDDSTARIP